MKYLNLVAAGDPNTPENVAVMRREIPGWCEEMDARGVRLLGRALELPGTAVTVRVRDGEALVTDGPFVEAKEFIAGFDLLDCADLDEAAEVAAKAPVSWFMTVEVRPFASQPLLGERASAFGRREDGSARPYALLMWADGTAVADASQPVTAEVETWRQGLADGGQHILGGTLAGAEAATTVRVRDGRTLLADGPFFTTGEYVAAIDVVRCAGREQAIALAAGHPGARSHPIEVRPFEG